jgi:hypothetical protein
MASKKDIETAVARGVVAALKADVVPDPSTNKSTVEKNPTWQVRSILSHAVKQQVVTRRKLDQYFGDHTPSPSTNKDNRKKNPDWYQRNTIGHNARYNNMSRQELAKLTKQQDKVIELLEKLNKKESKGWVT